MPSLKEIRSRITSVGSTMQITSTMKLVSVAKLKKSQDAIIDLRPYAQELKSLISNLVNQVDSNIESPFNQTNQSNKVLILCVSSNRGLCGAFNSNVIKRTKVYIKELKSENTDFEIYSFGKKANDMLSKDYKVTNFSSVFDNFSYEGILPAIEQILEEYAQGKFKKVVWIFNKFESVSRQIATVEQYLPLQNDEENNNSNEDYIFEPNPVEIIQTLIPLSLKTQGYGAFLNSIASEHSARMMAMHQATDNAKALKKSLTLTYNKVRQTSITKEILEIVGGAEALNA